MASTSTLELPKDASSRDYLITPNRLPPRFQSPARGGGGAAASPTATPSPTSSSVSAVGPSVGVRLYGAFLIGKCGQNYETSGPKRRVLLVRNDGLLFLSGAHYDTKEEEIIAPVVGDDSVAPSSERALEVATAFAVARRTLWGECALRRHIPIGKLKEATFYPAAEGTPLILKVFGEHDVYLTSDLRLQDDTDDAPNVMDEARVINPTFFSDCVSWRGSKSDENPLRYTFEVEQLRKHPSLQGPTGVVLDAAAPFPPSAGGSVPNVCAAVYAALRRALASRDSTVPLDQKAAAGSQATAPPTSASHSGVTLGCLGSTNATAATLQFEREVLPQLSLRKSALLATYCTTSQQGSIANDQQPSSPSGRAEAVMRQKVAIRNVARKASSPEAGDTAAASPTSASIYASHNNLRSSPSFFEGGGGSGGLATPVTLLDWELSASRLPIPLPLSRLPAFVDANLFHNKHIVMMGVVLAAFVDGDSPESTPPRGGNKAPPRQRCLLCFTSSKLYLIDYPTAVPTSTKEQHKRTLSSSAPTALTPSEGKAPILLEAPLMRLQEIIVDDVNTIDSDGVPEQASSVTLRFVEGGWRSNFAFSFPKAAPSPPSSSAASATKGNVVTSDVSAVSNVIRFLTRREGIDVPRLKFLNGSLVAAVRDATPQRGPADLTAAAVNANNATTSNASFGRPPMSPHTSSASLRSQSKKPVDLTEELVFATVPDFVPLKFFQPIDLPRKFGSHQEHDDGSGSAGYTVPQLRVVRKMREELLQALIPVSTKRLLSPLMTRSTVLCRRILRLTSKGAWEPRILVIVFNSTNRPDDSLASQVSGEGTKIVICNEKRGIRRMVSLLQVVSVTIATYRSCKAAEDTDSGGRAAERDSVQNQREREGLPPLPATANRVPHETALVLAVNREHDLVIKLHGDYANTNVDISALFAPKKDRGDTAPLLLAQAPPSSVTIPQVVTVLRFLQADLPIYRDTYYHDTAVFIREGSSGKKRITHGQLRDILSYKCFLEKPRDYEPVEKALEVAKSPLNTPRTPRGTSGFETANSSFNGGSFSSRRASWFVRDPSRSFSPDRRAQEVQDAISDTMTATVNGEDDDDSVPNTPRQFPAREARPDRRRPSVDSTPTTPQQVPTSRNGADRYDSGEEKPRGQWVGGGGGAADDRPNIATSATNEPDDIDVVPRSRAASKFAGEPLPPKPTRTRSMAGSENGLSTAGTPPTAEDFAQAAPSSPTRPIPKQRPPPEVPPAAQAPPKHAEDATAATTTPAPPATPTTAAKPNAATTPQAAALQSQITGEARQLPVAPVDPLPTTVPSPPVAATSTARPGSAPRGRHADPSAAASSGSVAAVSPPLPQSSSLVPQYVSPHRHERLGRLDALLVEKQRLEEEFKVRMSALESAAQQEAANPADSDDVAAVPIQLAPSVVVTSPSEEGTPDRGPTPSLVEPKAGRPPLAPSTPNKSRTLDGAAEGTITATSPQRRSAPQQQHPNSPSITRGFTAAAPSDTSRTIHERHQAELDELRAAADAIKVLPFRVKVKGDVFMIFLRSTALPSIYRNVIRNSELPEVVSSAIPKATLVCAELGFVCCLALVDLAKLVTESVEHGVLLLPDESCRPVAETLRIHRISADLFEGGPPQLQGDARKLSPFLFRFPTPTRGSEARLQSGSGGVGSSASQVVTEGSITGTKGSADDAETVVYRATACILCRSNESYSWELLPASTVSRVLEHNQAAQEAGGRNASVMSLSSAVERVTCALRDQQAQDNVVAGQPGVVADDDI